MVVALKKFYACAGSFSKCTGDCTTEVFSSTGRGITVRRKPDCLCHPHVKLKKKSGRFLLTSFFGAGAITNLVDHGRGHLAHVIVQGTSENSVFSHTRERTPNLRFGPCERKRVVT